MAGNEDEDRRRGEEKQKDEDGGGGKKKDVGSTSGGEVKKKGRFSIGSDSNWEGIGIDPSSLKDVCRFWEDVGWFVKDLAKIWPGNVASTSDIPEKVDDGTRKREPRVSERNLLMPPSSSDDDAGDPSGTPTSNSENTASEVGGISLGRSSKLANLSGTPTGSSETTAKSSENSRDVAGNEDEDCRRRGKEKQKDEDGSGGKKKDVASTSGGEVKKKGEFLIGSDSCLILESSENSRDMAGNEDEDHRRGKEKQKDEDGSGGKKKDVASTSCGGVKKKGRFSIGSDSDWKGIGIDPSSLKDVGRFWKDVGWFLKDFGKENQKDEDGRGEKKKDVGSTSGVGDKKLKKLGISDSDWVAIGMDPFRLKELAKRLAVKWPQVPDRNLRMPASSSENVAGDPSGSQEPCEYSTSSEAPPPTSSSDSDVDEMKKD